MRSVGFLSFCGFSLLERGARRPVEMLMNLWGFLLPPFGALSRDVVAARDARLVAAAARERRALSVRVRSMVTFGGASVAGGLRF